MELSNIGQFVLLNSPLSQAGTTVDGRHLVYEITGNISQSNIMIRTHGRHEHVRAKAATMLFGYGTNVKPTEKQKVESYTRSAMLVI